MEIQEIMEEYQVFCGDILEEEVETLVRICMMLRLPQKTVATALFNFFSAKKDIQLEPDDIVLHSACINMACRMCETHRPAEKIFEYASYQYALESTQELRAMYIACISKTELDVCVVLDFDFEIPDFYGTLESACRELGLSSNYSRRCWVFLNDLLMTPISVFFPVQEIVFGCLLVEFAATRAREGMNSRKTPEDRVSGKNTTSLFMEQIRAADVHGGLDCLVLELIALEVCGMYERGS